LWWSYLLFIFEEKRMQSDNNENEGKYITGFIQTREVSNDTFKEEAWSAQFFLNRLGP
jgi:hypothetical protein